MFEIEVARHSGFCFGVKEAIAKATETAANSGTPTKTYGPLIHNPQEIDRLREEYGIESVANLENFQDGNLVIRAHGVPPEDYERAQKNNLNIVDATCPFVIDVQDYAMEFCRKGYELFVVGDEHHAEIVGIVGHARKACPECVIHVVNDLQEILDKKPARAAIVFQTTSEFTKYKKIERYIREQKFNWKIKNTICGATKSNQYSADELARRVDVMLVIGGKNSGNTERLAEICASHTRAYHIETYSEIQREWLEGVRKIGITAGASTPQWLVDEVIEELEKIGSEQPLAF